MVRRDRWCGGGLGLSLSLSLSILSPVRYVCGSPICSTVRLVWVVVLKDVSLDFELTFNPLLVLVLVRVFVVWILGLRSSILTLLLRPSCEQNSPFRSLLIITPLVMAKATFVQSLILVQASAIRVLVLDSLDSRLFLF